MYKLLLFFAAVLIAPASFGACRDEPAAPGAASPAGAPPMVEMPLQGNQPMPIGMKKEGMMKDEVKKEYRKKEPMIEEMMEKGEMKK